MIHTKHGVRCERCFREEHDIEFSEGRRVKGAADSILRALGTGPRTLAELAFGVYGANRPELRRRVTWMLREHRDVVERVGPSTWALRKHAAEAAE